MAILTIYPPDQDPYALDITGIEQLTIGSSADSSIPVEHESVSEVHAVIEFVDGHYQVRDLESAAGTFVNGEPVSAVVLEHGARITFGEVETAFENAGEEAEDEVTESFDETGSAVATGGPVEIASNSSSPVGFKNLSPIQKVVKKDAVALISLVLGGVAILAAIAVVAFTVMMDVK